MPAEHSKETGVPTGGEMGRKGNSFTLDLPGGWEAVMANCVQCSVRSASVLTAGQVAWN